MSEWEPDCLSVVCSMEQCAVDVAVSLQLEEGARTGLYTWRPANSSAMWGLTLLQARPYSLKNFILFPNNSDVLRVCFIEKKTSQYFPTSLLPRHMRGEYKPDCRPSPPDWALSSPILPLTA